MKPSSDRHNTVVLSALGVVLLGAGGYGLARGYGAFGDAQGGEPVLGDDVRDFVGRNPDWFWPLAAVASLVMAWLAFRWLVSQIPPPGTSQLRVRDEADGSTDVLASGAAAALAHDIEDYPGVRWARVRVVTDGPRPEVEVTAEVDDGTEAAALRQRIDDHAFSRFCQALDLADLSPRVHLVLCGPAERSVR